MKKCNNCGRQLTDVKRYSTGCRYIAKDSIGRPVPAEVYGWVAKCTTCGEVSHELEGIGGLSKNDAARAYASMHLQAAEDFASQGDKKTAKEELQCVFLTSSQMDDDSGNEVLERIRSIAIKYDID
jgi:hypothetical protein